MGVDYWIVSVISRGTKIGVQDFRIFDPRFDSQGNAFTVANILAIFDVAESGTDNLLIREQSGCNLGMR